jgi:Zn-dependent protease
MDRTRIVSAPEVQESDVSRGRELAFSIGTFLLSFLVFAIGFGSWKFGLGFVLLLLVHELGHVLAARWQGVQVSLPTFRPFIGAYVTVRHAGLPPWRSALISLAGPFVGGLGAATAWAIGARHSSHWLVVLAYIWFLINAGNLLPVGILDGGGVVRGISQSRRGWIRYENGVPVEAVPPDTEHASLVTLLYVLLAVALVAGALATRHSAML